MIATANNPKTLQPSYHRNQQYSIVGLTNAAGTLVERYTYTAYGTLDIYAANGTVRTTSTCANRYTYTGREYDLDLKLYHFRARWYDPATGGFISRDPLGYVDGMSLYRGYFGVRGKDPTGRLLTHDGTLWPKSSSWPPVYVGGYSELLNPKRDQFTCCSDAIEQRLHVRYEGIWPGRREKISLGFVVCCDGVKHSCFTRAGGLSQTAGFEAGLIVNACLLEHEDSHHEHTEECAKSACANLYRPKLRTEFSYDKAECEAYTTHLRCLQRGLARCQNDDCREEVNREVELIINRLVGHCFDLKFDQCYRACQQKYNRYFERKAYYSCWGGCNRRFGKFGKNRQISRWYDYSPDTFWETL